MSRDLLVALCLVLVIEGMFPFIAPQRWRDMVVSLADAEPSTIRTVGLASMLCGAALLYVVRG